MFYIVREDFAEASDEATQREKIMNVLLPYLEEGFALPLANAVLQTFQEDSRTQMVHAAHDEDQGVFKLMTVPSGRTRTIVLTSPDC